MGEILTGTCSWTDPTLIDSGRFYPNWAKSAEDRLRFYSSQFNIVEVDSTYYSMPSERTNRLWAERTPSSFTFDVKTFRLFTQHPTPISAFPKDIRQQIPAQVNEKGKAYLRDLPSELAEEMWSRLEQALLPLDSAGKLGVVLFQFPPWFFPGRWQSDYILFCKERLPQYRVAIEFRNSAWLNEKNRGRSLQLLRDNNLPFVCVDEPQGFKSSVPPVAEATSPDVSLIRFHGRNRDMWEAKGITPVERFNYLYSQDELKEWAPRVKELANQTSEVHVLFNNCYGDKAVVNARQMGFLLAG